MKFSDVPHPISLLHSFAFWLRQPPAYLIQREMLRRGIQPEPDSLRPIFIEEANGLKWRAYQVATNQNLSDIFTETVAELTRCGVPNCLGAASDRWSQSINILATDAERTVDIVKRFWGNADHVFAHTGGKHAHHISHLNSRKIGKLSLLCGGRREQARGAMTYSTIEINLWREVKSYSEAQLFETSAKSPFVKRLSGTRLASYMAQQEDLDALSSEIDIEPSFPIDVVYTWVDDRDDDWRSQKNEFSKKCVLREKNSGRAYLDERFQNRDELKYSLRSLELFAPFVRDIYIVTCGHLPKWLNTQHPKVKTITHDQIYSNPTHLPTFNSSGIETQLHHIKGLSEYFLYLNDDFFFGDLCKAGDFFHASGILKAFPSGQRMFEHDLSGHIEEYQQSDRNAIELMLNNFGKASREVMLHAPYASSRSLLTEIERRFQKNFDDCSANKFRSKGDLRPIAFFQYHYGFMTRHATRSEISHNYIGLWRPDLERKLAGMLQGHRYKTFCLNDVGIAPEHVNNVNQVVNHFLESYFPFKSEFETS